jgi:integrase
VKSSAVRHILRWLWEAHGAPKLDNNIRHYTGVRPRNVTATREEIDAILDAALPGMRLWILLCSDLAIRSGTASKLNWSNYDPETRTLRFTTKHNARLALPVTDEIRELIEACDPHSHVPFVRQLWTKTRPRAARPIGPGFDDGGKMRMHFQALCRSVGIDRRIIPHDLRRTTAVAMLELTGDVRDVQTLLGHRNLQSTLWYLDHDLRPVKRSSLELIKTHAWRQEHTA